uniref:UPF0102 protein BECKTUN1418D_GA0071000_11129 n=1 Tax=Candidatus Kentrum sp. TUN TaxID=2126343 RepID=A0A450ZI50_9GAMM|nr:MAG: putative endonuclease [Candidatus Kentron sp. TUN]VFK53449.1 MAG: putative endonuclease [Candidatus Kentron sp. TUN]VFK59975.1 MAG: putative endonuclease [Candidatus Kentron sp. TUN]
MLRRRALSSVKSMFHLFSLLIRDGKHNYKDLSCTVSPGKRGVWGEKLAENYLHDKGMKMLERNYRCKFGEIDLIMGEDAVDGDMTVVFVEVRFRSNSHFGTGLESVDSRKQRRIIMTAHHYLRQNPTLRDKPCRFDIISISPQKQNNGICWIPAAFEA